MRSGLLRQLFTHTPILHFSPHSVAIVVACVILSCGRCSSHHCSSAVSLAANDGSCSSARARTQGEAPMSTGTHGRQGIRSHPWSLCAYGHCAACARRAPACSRTAPQPPLPWWCPAQCRGGASQAWRRIRRAAWLSWPMAPGHHRPPRRPRLPPPSPARHRRSHHPWTQSEWAWATARRQTGRRLLVGPSSRCVCREKRSSLVRVSRLRDTIMTLREQSAAGREGNSEDLQSHVRGRGYRAPALQDGVIAQLHLLTRCV